MKNIMVLAHDDAGQESRFQCALDLTRAVSGHLTCVDVARLPVVAGDYYGGTSGATVIFDERDREAENAVRMKARLEKEDVAWDWIDVTDNIADGVRTHAGLADAVVVSLKLQSEALPDMRFIASAIATGVRGLMVAVPEDCERFDVFGRVIIAWDGSAPALAALRGAVPILALASSVCLLSVNDGSKGVEAEEAAAYLSRHSIHATVKRVSDSFIPADSHIREACDTTKAAYCVMGAYGHSRMTEALFGGVTRRMLASSRIPLVMCH